MRRCFTLSSNAFVPLAMMLGITLAATSAAFAQQVTLVSSASDGTPGAGGESSNPTISADGRFVAFTSAATNLVPGDSTPLPSIFVKDRVSGAIARVSVSTSGQQLGFGAYNAKISADGRFVIFDTIGQGVADDTNPCRIDPPSPCTDVYVRDRQANTTTRVSVSSSGAQVVGSSRGIDISADGRFVLFSSAAANLVPNDTNQGDDLFLRDRLNGTTTLVSRDSAGNQLGRFGVTGRMSADGRIIIYTPAAGSPGAEVAVVHQYDRETGVVSVLSDAFPQKNSGGSLTVSYTPSFISHDGRHVIVGENAERGSRDLLHDRLTGHTVATPWWTASPLGRPLIVALSGDGRTYAYGGRLRALGLVDRITGFWEVVPSSLSMFASGSLSFDGRFTTFATTVVGGPGQQVYVFDRDSGDSDGMPSEWETKFGLNPTNLTDANADADLDGVTNLQEYVRGSHPANLASATRYFAEGASNAFFTTRFAAVNPGDEKATVVFRFLGSNGQTSSVMGTIEPRSRITWDLPANGPTPGNDFSTVVESDRLVVVDRTMTWDSTGYGAHTETALTAPSTTWYLAEGATHGAFDLFYLLQNANDSDAHVTVNYLRQAPLKPVSKTYTVERNSRKTIQVDAEGADLEAVDTAASFTSDLPIVVERAMYSTRVGQPPFAAGHGAAGVPSPALRWFLAEGATGEFFDLYVLVGNPNPTAANLKVTYLLPSGTPFEKEYSVGPQQRLTIYVQDEDPRLASTPVSVIVESTNEQPVVVERAMWWPKGQWNESHVSAGATTTGTKWALADGEVTLGGDTYILIANTSTTAGTATVTLLEEGVAPLPITVELPASSRVNVPVSQYLPATAELPRRRVGALIETNGIEIVVERSIYATINGITWDSGTCALGTKLQ